MLINVYCGGFRKPKWVFLKYIIYLPVFAYIDDKVSVVHKRDDRIGPNGRLTFANGTELPPFPESVDEVTFTWLATEKEEVI